MENKEFILNQIRIVIRALEDKKAQEIRVLDIHEISVMADYFIIANGTNINQVHALADFVEEELSKTGCRVKHTEGYQSGNWILMDYGDFIVHIFDQENRLFYDLERIWRDGKQIRTEELLHSS